MHKSVFWIDREPSIHSGRHTDPSLENCGRKSDWCTQTDGYVCVYFLISLLSGESLLL